MKMPNGYGSIDKLSGKRRKPYRVRSGCVYSLDGNSLKETRQVIGYYATRQEAIDALAEYNRDPYDLSGAKLTLQQVYDEWRSKSKLAKATLKGYSNFYKKLSSLTDYEFSRITVAMLQDCIDTCTPPTQRSVKALLHDLYDFAIKHELCKKDLSQLITTDAVTEHKAKTPFAEDEIAALWQSPQSIARDATLILIYTGWRAKELLSCTIDTEQGTMIGGIKTAAGKNRVVPIHSRIRPLIERNIEMIQSISYRTLFDYVSRYGHAPHECRHTFVSRLIAAGVDEIIVQKLVGHASNVTRDVYTHIGIDTLRSAVEMLK